MSCRKTKACKANAMTSLISSKINSLSGMQKRKKDNIYCPKSYALKKDPRGHVRCILNKIRKFSSNYEIIKSFFLVFAQGGAGCGCLLCNLFAAITQNIFIF